MARCRHRSSRGARTSRAITVLVGKRLAARHVLPGDTRRARIVLTASGRRLYDEVFPQVAAINARLASVPDEDTVRVLDRALAQLTEQAERLNAEVVRDVRADRRAEGSRRIRRWAEQPQGPAGYNPPSVVPGKNGSARLRAAAPFSFA